MGRRERRKALRERLRRTLAGALTASLLLTAMPAVPAFAVPAGADFQGSLASVEDVQLTEDGTVATITFNNGIQGKIKFLDDGIMRYTVDPSNAFSEYAKPNASSHEARIQAQPDDDTTVYSHPAAKLSETDEAFVLTTGDTTVTLDKDTATMSVSEGGEVVMEEATGLSFRGDAVVQTLLMADGEDFYGGGTQAGRMVHTGETIDIADNGVWTDGGVPSANPFYWSTDGYGVLRNTFKPGAYNFGDGQDVVTTSHDENIYDAYIFTTDPAPVATNAASSTGTVAQNLLNDFYTVTGNPVLLPDYAFYLGHLNAYNRDSWSTESGDKGWTIKGDEPYTSEGTTTYETGMDTEYVLTEGVQAESLNGDGNEVLTEATQNIPAGVTYPYEYSARAVIDEYQSLDMPLGWFLPNDGYGAGYGKNGYNVTGGVESDGSSSAERLAAVDANVQNLAAFTAYANERGVQTGLWTQSDLEPDSDSTTYWHRLRDFEDEVSEGGVRTLKTDVAWVGSGYSFELDGVAGAYQTATSAVGERPNIVTLCGWAGTQRYGSIWTGDQAGGEWEYIRFHIPTYIGQGLSGNPNVGSDMDGIHGGGNEEITTRDYQWKAFTPQMLDMDGWGTVAKTPYTSGDPYTGINRMYLKLKAQLMPYTLTTAAAAANVYTENGDGGLPIVRAMTLVDDSDYAASEAVQYQYMYGNEILVAPIYQNTEADDMGNDVRNNIYLPNFGTEEEPTIWIDYWTGEQYQGGQVLNNYDAPIWKLPVFVKANAIVPMWAENNNPQAVSATNPDGLDKTQPIVAFYAVEGEGEYHLFEDDGASITNTMTEDDEYGTIESVDYGGNVSTTFTSSVDAGVSTFTAEASTGGYEGYDSMRTRTFVVNLADGYNFDEDNVTAMNGEAELNLVAVDSKDALDEAEPEAGTAVYFFDKSPVIETYAPEGEELIAEQVAGVAVNPRLYVKFAETDVNNASQTLTIENFDNSESLPENVLDQNLAVPNFSQDLLGAEGEAPETATPTSITLTWDDVDGATSYELMIDGTLYSVGDTTEYTHIDLAYDTQHTYQVRARGANGYSAWSDKLPLRTALDPWRNTPTPVSTSWEGDYYAGRTEALAFDHIFQTGDGGFHSDGNNLGQALTVDYGLAYTFDELVYYPRDDAGNGTVTSMKIETSLDGNHWTTISEGTAWEASADAKTVDFPQGTTARFVRLTPVASVGGYFSASEIAINVVDGTSGFAVGSTMGMSTVTEADVTNMMQYLAAKRGDNAYAQLYGRGDLNGNGYYDAYDYAWTLGNVDGGTKQTGDVAGSLTVIPSATSASAGDTITVSLYANDVQNANALGAVIPYDRAQLAFVDDSIDASPYLGAMQDLSVARTHDDGSASVNLAFVNRGNQALYSGAGVVATFKFEALTDIDDVALAFETFLVGPTFDCIETRGDGTVDLPEVPEPQEAIYGQDAFDITITNERLLTDDGTNVTKISQGGSYDQLFDGVTYHDGSSGSGVWEFAWGGNEYTKFPTTFHFAFKEPSSIDDVVLYNRRDVNGTVGGNGYVTDLDATITYVDGATDTFNFDAAEATYTFTPSAANESKLVACVDVTINDANGAAGGMLTLSEIAFNYMIGTTTVTGIELGDNETKLYEGDITPVHATVQPADAAYPHFEVTSSDSDVVSVSRAQEGDDVVYYLVATGAGTATITVSSPVNPDVSQTYEVTVAAGVDTSALTQIMEEAGSYSATVYTEDTYAALADALEQAQAVLDGGNYTANDIAAQVMGIQDAIDGLEFRPVDADTLINTAAYDEAVGGVHEVATSTTVEGDSNDVLDYDESTYWHSSYATGATLPQWIMFDLDGSYDLTDITFLPRQDGALRGDIFGFDVVVAQSQEDLEAYIANGYAPVEGSTAVRTGSFEFDNNGHVIDDRDVWKQASFPATNARYALVVVTSSGGNDQGNNLYCNMAEVRFYGAEHSDTPAVDMSELRATYDAYVDEALDEVDFTAETWVPFANAMADAKRMLEQGADSQDAVESCLAALTAAHDALVKTEVPSVDEPDAAALQALVDQLAGTDLSGKTVESAQRFVEALAGARDVLAMDDASAEQIKAAYDELKAAYDALEDKQGTVTPEQPGIDDLRDFIAQVEGTDLSGMTDASAQAFKDALAVAQGLGDDATAEDILAAYRALAEAYDGLTLKNPTPGKPGGVVTDEGDDGLAGTGDASLPVAGVAVAAVLAVAVAVIVRLRTRRD